MTQIGLFDSPAIEPRSKSRAADGPPGSSGDGRPPSVTIAPPARPTVIRGKSIMRLISETTFEHEVEDWKTHRAVFVWINVRNDSGSTCRFGQAESLDDAPCRPSPAYDAHLAAVIDKLKPLVIERAVLEGKL